MKIQELMYEQTKRKPHVSDLFKQNLYTTKTVKFSGEDTNIKSFEDVDFTGVELTKLSLNHFHLKNLAGLPKNLEFLHVIECELDSLSGSLPKVLTMNLLECKGIQDLTGLHIPSADVFTIAGGTIRSFRGHTITHMLNDLILEEVKIETFEHCPSSIKVLTMENVYKISYHNIYKYIKHLEQLHIDFLVPDMLDYSKLKPSPILGILRISGLTTLESVFHPFSILSKYIPLKTMSDIIRCKQELIDSGFKEWGAF